jgi:outer membrane protein OmpA-like peptidoglycan-associated protein
MRRLATLLLLFCFSCGGAWAADGTVRRFVVFFPEWSAALDASAEGVIGQAASFAKAQSQGTVTVIGFADTTGSKTANVLLSQLRAQRVSDLLQTGGVAQTRIHPIGRGSVTFAMTSQESRRVEIAITGR